MFEKKTILLIPEGPLSNACQSRRYERARRAVGRVVASAGVPELRKAVVVVGVGVAFGLLRRGHGRGAAAAARARPARRRRRRHRCPRRLVLVQASGLRHRMN